MADKQRGSGWLPAPVRRVARAVRRRRWRHRRRGDQHRAARDWLAAAQAYEAHLRAFPGDAAIWVQLGHMRKEAGELPAAALAYDAALRLIPGDGDLLLSLGRLHRLLGDPAEAARFLWESFQADPSPAIAGELAEPALWPHLAARSGEMLGQRRQRCVVPVGALDQVADGVATGWAFDPAGAAELLFFQNGKLIGEGQVDRVRPDRPLLDAGLLNGFAVALDLDFTASTTVSVSARHRRTLHPLAGSPLTVPVPPTVAGWLSRGRVPAGDELRLVRERANHGLGGTLSIVMPVHDPRPGWLGEAIASVEGQWSDAWELICVDDRSADPDVVAILADAARREPRIRVETLVGRGGLAKATNRGIEVARGDYVALLDHDDLLEPDAVARMLAAAALGPDLIYSDEIVTGEAINALRHVVARPAFSYDYYLSHPYFVHFIAVERRLALATPWDEAMTISGDVDFVLRCLERARTVAHVPSPLYRWRTHPGSTGHLRKAAVTAATTDALNRHLARMGGSGRAAPGACFNCFRIDFADQPAPTAVIIPTRNQQQLLAKALDSLWRTTSPDLVRVFVIDHQSDDPAFRAYVAGLGDKVTLVSYAGSFNFSRMNNQAVVGIDGRYRYLLFMNNDVEALEAGWLEHMRGLCAREEVGAVGATLLYPDRRIQHAGVVVGLNGLADHGQKFRPFGLTEDVRNPGYNGSLASTRDVSAVTAACMMMRRSVFEELGGFDERLEIGFNDADLCLRARQRGWSVLTDAHAVLLHHESASRHGEDELRHPRDSQLFAARWQGLMGGADPFYSPMLGLVPPGDFIGADLDRCGAAPRLRPGARRQGASTAHRVEDPAYVPR